MSAELNGADPSFTIRRNIQHALEDRVVVEELKKVSQFRFITPPAATAVCELQWSSHVPVYWDTEGG